MPGVKIIVRAHRRGSRYSFEIDIAASEHLFFQDFELAAHHVQIGLHVTFLQLGRDPKSKDFDWIMST